MKRPMMLNQKTRNVWDSLVAVLLLFIVAFLLVEIWFAREFVVVEVAGGSMENTLQDGDILYADRFAQPERGDIIIIDVSDNGSFTGDLIIKRLIAVEGDAVKCEAGFLSLRKAGETEFVILEEPYVDYLTDDFPEITVGEGEIFFLGDHRNNSFDSRDRNVGCLRRTDIVGVVPEWALKGKSAIGVWESLRAVFGRRTKTEES